MEQVEKGYKQTEIGIIPDNWEVKVFQDFADKKIKWSITGGPFGSNLKASDYTSEGVRIIQLQNIGDGVFWDDYKIYTSERKADELLSCNIYPNEIIISKMGDPVARACIIPEIEKRYLMASDGIRLVINEKEYDKKFAFFYINSIYFRKRAFEVSMGSTRLRIGLPQLKDLSVIKPPKEEQTAIATALSEVDSYIQSLEQVIEKKRLIKKGAMQELLTPKPHWEVKKLGEILIIRHGKSQKEVMTIDGQYPILASGGEIGRAKAFLYDKPSVLIGRKGTIDKPQFMNSPFWCVDTLFYTEINKNYNAEYIFYLFQLIDWYNFNEASGVPSLNARTIENIEKSFPPTIEEQIYIINILSSMGKEIEDLEQKLEKAKQIKQGMMQQLLTGKIRLV